MKELLKILILEDSPADAEIIQRLLVKKKLNCEFSVANNKKTYVLALDQYHPDIILSDHSLPQFNSTDALAIARQQFPGIPFIMVTGTVSDEFAADIMKSGADDYILKDRLTRLPAAIDTILRQRKTEKEKLEATEKLKRSEEKYRTLFFKSPLPKWIYDYETLRFLDVNEAAILQYGYSREEFLYMTIRDIRPKEDIEPLLDDIKKVQAGPVDSRQGHWRHLKKNGEVIIVETKSHTIAFNNGKARMVVANDITERINAEQKIIQSEANLKTIFESTSEGFLLMDRNAVVMAFNNKAVNYALFSKKEEIQIGQSIYDSIEESRRSFFQGIVSKALKGESIQFERSYDMWDGNISWIDFSVKPVIEDSHVKGICITGRDITEKKMIEQEREFDRNNLKALINNTHDLLWSVDRDFKLITSNEAFDKMVKAMSGKTVEKGSGILARGFSKEQQNRFRKYYERAFSGESFTEIEYADSPDDFVSEISFYPIYNGDTVIGAACFSRDITAGKKAEKEISDYKNALDQSSIVSITDNEGIIKYVNNNFCIISGYSTVELLGHTHLIVNSCYHPKAFMKDLWTTIGNGKIWRGEFCNKTKDETLYWVEATIVPFLNDKGKPVQYLEITNDITEKKLMAQEILEHKVQEQKKIARAIIKAQEKERNYIGQELHDNITQLLASTKLYLGTTIHKNEEFKELIKYPMELIDSSINEIRLLSSKLVTPLKNINLQELVQELIRKLDLNTIIKTDFTYSVSNSVSNEFFSDDLKLNIYRVIQEQMNNILKYAEAKNVNISIKAQENTISIEICDDGRGFDVEKKRNGIGISNMINRIESFNGEVAIESSPAKGCKISFKIAG
jgi:PAS domain S-box-containing protein